MRRVNFVFLGLTLLVACGGDDSTLPTPDASMDSAVRDDGATMPDAMSTPDAPPSDSSSSDGASDPCGGCPTGTTCGTANGVPACLTPSGIPRFSHVFVIVMENTSLSTLLDATNTPYIDSLFADWASSSAYHGVAHPSLPNYIAMTSGADVGDIGCDCEPMGSECGTFNCNAVLHNCGCPQSVTHLGNQLEDAGATWKDYGEDMGAPCGMTSHGDYVPRHVPFLYYDDVQSDPARCADHIVDYDAFADDLAADPPTFSFIAPNLVNDMHDPITGGSGNLANGDAWLSENVPPILASPAFTDGGLLVIVWDEDDLSGVLAADDPVALIVLSPYGAHDGYVSTIRADHSSLLATIEDGLGLDRLGSAVDATPLADFFAF